MRILLIIENLNYKRNIFSKILYRKFQIIFETNVKLSQVLDFSKRISLKISNHIT